MDETNSLSEIEKLKTLLQSADLPTNLHDKAAEQIERIYLTLKHGGNLAQLDITAKYIDWIVNIPWNKKTEDFLDIERAKQILEQNHFGLEKIKQRIIEFISVLILQKRVLTRNYGELQIFFLSDWPEPEKQPLPNQSLKLWAENLSVFHLEVSHQLLTFAVNQRLRLRPSLV